MEEPKLLTLKQVQTYILATFNPQIRWGVLRAACANGKLKAEKRRFAGQRTPGNQLWLVAQAELDAFMVEELAAEGRPRSGAPRGVSYARPRNVKGRPTNLGPSRKILIDLPLSELTLIDQDIKAGLASSRNERIRQLLREGRQAEAGHTKHPYWLVMKEPSRPSLIAG